MSAGPGRRHGRIFVRPSLFHPVLQPAGYHSAAVSYTHLEIRRSLSETSFARMTENVKLRYSQLDSYACYNGAMKYFFDHHYQFTEPMEGSFFIG